MPFWCCSLYTCIRNELLVDPNRLPQKMQNERISIGSTILKHRLEDKMIAFREEKTLFHQVNVPKHITILNAAIPFSSFSKTRNSN